jgi:hypothetical protein
MGLRDEPDLAPICRTQAPGRRVLSGGALDDDFHRVPLSLTKRSSTSRKAGS